MDLRSPRKVFNDAVELGEADDLLPCLRLDEQKTEPDGHRRPLDEPDVAVQDRERGVTRTEDGFGRDLHPDLPMSDCVEVAEARQNVPVGLGHAAALHGAALHVESPPTCHPGVDGNHFADASRASDGFAFSLCVFDAAFAFGRDFGGSFPFPDSLRGKAPPVCGWGGRPLE